MSSPHGNQNVLSGRVGSADEEQGLFRSRAADALSGAAGAEMWSIGSVTVQGLAVLAPMAGVTDFGMRRVAQQFGAAFTVSEMVAAPGLARGDTEHRIRAEGRGMTPHVVQIAGCRTTDMAEAARLAEGSGATWIDINMGCPSKRVTGGEAGSALMRDLPHAVALIRATVSAVSIPVTVKMRLGWDDACRNAPDLACQAEQEGVAMITVHARTRCQFYKGAADWPAVRSVTEAVRIPVVVNGDCMNADDARRMLSASGARAVMIGRAAVGQPWIVGDISHSLAKGQTRRPVPAAARALAAQGHYEWLLAAFGTEKGLRHARKHLAGYVTHAAIDATEREALRARLVRSETPDDVLAALSQVFTEDQGERHDARAA